MRFIVVFIDHVVQLSSSSFSLPYLNHTNVLGFFAKPLLRVVIALGNRIGIYEKNHLPCIMRNETLPSHVRGKPCQGKISLEMCDLWKIKGHLKNRE